MTHNYGSTVVPYLPLAVASGSNNNMAIGKASTVKLVDTSGGNPAADYSITGFAGPEHGKIIRVWNRSSFNANLQHESGSSTAANRIVLTGSYPTGAVMLRPYRFMDLYYDDATFRWYPMLSGQGAWRAFSSSRNIVRVSADYTVLPDDEIIEVDLAAASGNVTVSLNDSGDQPDGQVVTVKLVTEDPALSFSVAATGAATVEPPPPWITDFTGGIPGQEATWYYNATQATWYLLSPHIIIPAPIYSVLSADFTVNNSTTLVNTGLSAPVVSGGKYSFRAVLNASDPLGNSGYKYAISGTSTAIKVIYTVVSFATGSGGVIAISERRTAMGGAVDWPTNDVAPIAYIDGYIEVDDAGTLTVQFAQSVASAEDTKVLAGSTFEVKAANV